MKQFTLYTIDGKEAGKVDMPAIFQEAVNEKLIHRYVTWVRSMLRSTIAHTKTRGEVSGGGKKPWRQKGTGRARVGSTRNPVWRHGGTVFGPRNEQTFATRMPRSERQKAFASALSSKANQVVVLKELSLPAPKTKEMIAILSKLPHQGKKVLHIHPEHDINLFASTRNLPYVHSTTVAELNVLDVLNHDVLLLTADGLTALDKHFNPTV